MGAVVKRDAALPLRMTQCECELRAGLVHRDQLLQVDGRADRAAVDGNDHLSGTTLPAAGRSLYTLAMKAPFSRTRVVAQLLQRHRRRDLLGTHHLAEVGLATHRLGDAVRIDTRLRHERRAVAGSGTCSPSSDARFWMRSTK